MNNMPVLNRLARIGFAFIVATALLGVAGAGNKKADHLMEQGRAAEARQDYIKALSFYQEALELDPSDAYYQLSARRARFEAGQVRVDIGQKLRREGKLQEALEEFSKALAIDPSSAVAEQEAIRTRQMIERNKKEGGAKTSEERGLTPVLAARRETEKRVGSILTVPHLKPLNPQLSNLKMANQPVKVLYETVGKLAGINVLFDSEFQDNQKKFTLDLSNTTIDEALDYVSLLTKTYWKPLSANTIFVINDNVTKRRDYEEHVTRVFYLQNISTPQELNEAMTVMRTITEIRKVFPFNSQNAIVVRGTVDQVALAEKILMDIDKPKSEVVVDVLVMEANKNLTRDLANTLISGGKPGLVLGIGFVGEGTTSGGDGTGSGTGSSTSSSTTVPIGRLGSLNANNWAVTMPGYLLQAVMSDSDTRVKQYPQVRATDGQKASLRLGDRYPYATGSFQPGVGAVGVSPLVSTQFQFADVGVNVDVTPRIHSADEVSLQVELEISAIKDRIDVGGLSQPVIGQRKVSHIVRVKEGEVTVIGGLMQATESKTKSGVPGLMDIPGIGKWFTSNSYNKTTGDLLVALIPHVVRSPDITPENLRTIASGTDQVWKLNYAPEPAPEKPAAEPPKPAPAPAPVPAPGLVPGPVKPATPGLPIPGLGQAAPPAAAPAVPQQPAPDAPAAAAPEAGAPNPSQPSPETPPPPPAAPQVTLTASAPSVQVGETVTVTVSADKVKDLFSAPMRIRYDQKVLSLEDVQGGDLFRQDGQSPVFQHTAVENSGVVIIINNRMPGSSGVSGSGGLVQLKFKALAPGASPVFFEDLSLRDAQLRPIDVERPRVSVTVK